MKYRWMLQGCALAMALTACEQLDDDPARHVAPEGTPYISLEEVAQLLSGIPVGMEQMQEVSHAVGISTRNGYDEEYTLQDLFAAPGEGVGGSSEGETRAPEAYAHPLRDLIRDAVRVRFATRSGDDPAAEAYVDSLSASDIQIYWPYADRWDGEQTPVITFDPGDMAERNVGYVLAADGTVTECLVDEEMARERPVWVVNRNSDADYRTLEMLRRENPAWGEGGEIVVKPRSVEGDIKTLVLRTFKSNRNYDSWFAGASEFFVKVGAVEDFRASTEAELLLYQPSITDFMIVMRRSQVGEELPFNAVLVSEWTDQLSSCAFMVVEDDGGSRTSWKCSATVKYNSKSYGFDLEIPIYTRDDIVWRGALTRSYIEKYSGTTGHFGDVDLVLELI